MIVSDKSGKVSLRHLAASNRWSLRKMHIRHAIFVMTRWEYAASWWHGIVNGQRKVYMAISRSISFSSSPFLSPVQFSQSNTNHNLKISWALPTTQTNPTHNKSSRSAQHYHNGCRRILRKCFPHTLKERFLTRSWTDWRHIPNHRWLHHGHRQWYRLSPPSYHRSDCWSIRCHHLLLDLRSGWW